MPGIDRRYPAIRRERERQRKREMAEGEARREESEVDVPLSSRFHAIVVFHVSVLEVWVFV